MIAWVPAAGRSRAPALAPAAERLLLGAVPILLTAWLAVSAIRFHWVAEDFSLAYYPAAHRLLGGVSPYAATHAQLVGGAAFVYPALAAVLIAPLALVGSAMAAHLYTLLCLAMVPGSLWALGVRDWRIYGVTLLWFPMVIGWQGENISVPLMFLVALAWRYRDRDLAVAVLVASAVSVKPFLWPLVLWLPATRRYAAAAWAVCCGALLNLGGWALVGFGQLPQYLHLARADVSAMWRGGYGLLAICGHLGLSRVLGEVLLLALAAALGLVLVHMARVRRRERHAYAVAVALMLIASPLVWIHYFVFLLVPLALLRPRFSAAWTVPLGMWLLPPAPAVDGMQVALGWGLAGVSLVTSLYPGRAPSLLPAVRALGERSPSGGRDTDVRLGYGLNSTGSATEEPASAAPFGPRQVPNLGLMVDY